MKKRLIVGLSALFLLASAACTPQEMALNDYVNGWQQGHTERISSGSNYECPGSRYGYLIDRYFEHYDRGTACRVMLCESHGHGADPVTIQNPRSSASGLFQFLDSTWRSAARYYPPAGNYSRAMYAPASVQVATAAAWQNATSWSQWSCY